MDKIATLIAAMTLAEKLGQMTMASGSDAVTGPVGPRRSRRRHSCRARRLDAQSLRGRRGPRRPENAWRRAASESRSWSAWMCSMVTGTIFPFPWAKPALSIPPPGRRRPARRRRRPRGTASRSPSRPCWMSRAIPAGAGSAEGPGEDPLCTAGFGKAKVRGFQGADLASRCGGGTAKHFVAYGAVSAGESMPRPTSRSDLHEVICRLSRQQSRPGARPSCPPSPLSPASP